MESEDLALIQDREVTTQNNDSIGHLWIVLKRTGLRHARNNICERGYCCMGQNYTGCETWTKLVQKTLTEYI